MIHGANARGSVGMRDDVSRLIVMLRHRAARHADPVAGDDGQKQRAVVPMVIVLRNGRVKPNSASARKPSETGVSVISPRSVPKSVYVGFIAILKLPFKFDRS
jgi:hypothetical protein